MSSCSSLNLVDVDFETKNCLQTIVVNNTQVTQGLKFFHKHNRLNRGQCFYRSKDPTNRVKALKGDVYHRCNDRNEHRYGNIRIKCLVVMGVPSITCMYKFTPKLFETIVGGTVEHCLTKGKCSRTCVEVAEMFHERVVSLWGAVSQLVDWWRSVSLLIKFRVRPLNLTHGERCV